jgi:predicted acylesterase/phospholipase RssA
MSTPNVQLAFQGGGAKLVVMLPVADAFLKAQNRGLIKITAVSGTSAGAICAALVACGADFSKVLDFLKEHGSEWADAMVPAAVRPLKEHGTDLGWWQIYNNREVLRDVFLKGKPLLDGDALKNFIKALFKKSTDPKNPNIEKRATTLSIIASDIAKSKAIVHQSGDLVSALVDSCSLPIVFRSFNSLATTHYVDGGLCDNLPVEGLLSARNAATFAIFPIEEAGGATGETKNNLITYLLALFSASINHGVSRSMAMVSEPFRFGIETNIGLLEFDEALDLLRQPNWYETRRDEAFKRIEDFARSYGVINDPNDARVVDVIDIGQYQQALTELSDDFASHLEIQRARFMVRVNCDEIFNNEKDAADRTSDTITRVTEFKVLSDKASCYRSYLIMTDDNIVPTVLSARNLTRKAEIPIRALALGKTVPTENFKHCLIQFIEPSQHIGVGDVIEIRGVYYSTPKGDMRLLNLLKNDFFGFTNSQLPTVSKAELVLIYPKRIGPLQLVHYPKCSRSKMEPMTFDKDDRDLLGEAVDVTGVFVQNLAKDERLYSLVIRTS